MNYDLMWNELKEHLDREISVSTIMAKQFDSDQARIKAAILKAVRARMKVIEGYKCMQGVRHAKNDPFRGISDEDIELAVNFEGGVPAEYDEDELAARRAAYKKAREKLYETLFGIRPEDTCDKVILAIRGNSKLYRAVIEYCRTGRPANYFAITFPKLAVASDGALGDGFRLLDLDTAKSQSGDSNEESHLLFKTHDLEEMRNFINNRLEDYCVDKEKRVSEAAQKALESVLAEYRAKGE